MSVSKWAWTEACNGKPCPGDCDYCILKDEYMADDYKSRYEAAVRIIDIQQDTISKYQHVFKLQEEELKKLRKLCLE